MTRKLISLFLCSLLLTGCATNYFPLRKESFFSQHQPETQSVFIMPFSVDILMYPNFYNTLEKLEKRRTQARGFVINSLKKVFSLHNFQVIGSVSLDEIKDEKFDEELKIIMFELFDEINSARYCISNNFKSDKGKINDYSIGIRVREFSQKQNVNPDYFVFLFAGGVVVNLDVFETNAINAATAILSLGMSKLMPTPDDTVDFTIYLIDAKTGDIVWVNTYSAYTRSFLAYDDVYDGIKTILEPLGKESKK